MANGNGAARTAMDAGAKGLPARDEIAAYHLLEEDRLVGGLVERAIYSSEERRRIATLAHRLVTQVREGRQRTSGIDALMTEYALSSEEGVILMCLAESLLRIPDSETADQLIAEKIGSGRWVKPPRPLRKRVRECLDLGPIADRPDRQARQGSRRQAGEPPQTPRREIWRARHPASPSPGDARDG